MPGLSKDQLGALLVLLFALAYMSQVDSIPVLDETQGITPRSMPIFLLMLAMPLSLWLMIPRSEEKPAFAGLNWRLLGVFIALMLVYSLVIRPLGFILSSSLFLLAGFLLLGFPAAVNKGIFFLYSVLLASGAAVLFWLLMDQVLGIYVKPLP